MRTDQEIIYSLKLALSFYYSSNDGLLSDKLLNEIIAGEKDQRFTELLAKTTQRYVTHKLNINGAVIRIPEHFRDYF